MLAADFRQLDKLHLCGEVIWCEHIAQELILFDIPKIYFALSPRWVCDFLLEGTSSFIVL